MRSKHAPRCRERTNFRIFFAQPSEQRGDTLGEYTRVKNDDEGEWRKKAGHTMLNMNLFSGGEER
jgi:hypothetical protein